VAQALAGRRSGLSRHRFPQSNTGRQRELSLRVYYQIVCGLDRCTEEVQMKPGLAAALLAGLMSVLLLACVSEPRYGEVVVREPHVSMRVVFTDYDRRLIREYYEPRYHKLPPGQVKKGWIPPGHAWRVRSNQPVHEEAYWRYLPYDLDQRLSRLPPDYVRVVIGTDVAIMNTRTRVVVDVLEDITD